MTTPSELVLVPREVVVRRIADLKAANVVLSAMETDTSLARERNSREIQWLDRIIDPDEAFGPDEPTLGEKWQAEATRVLARSPAQGEVVAWQMKVDGEWSSADFYTEAESAILVTVTRQDRRPLYAHPVQPAAGVREAFTKHIRLVPVDPDAYERHGEYINNIDDNLGWKVKPESIDAFIAALTALPVPEDQKTEQSTPVLSEASNVITLPARDLEMFLEALNTPTQPNLALVELLRSTPPWAANNERILGRMRGVAAQPATAESESAPCNPNVGNSGLTTDAPVTKPELSGADRSASETSGGEA